MGEHLILEAKKGRKKIEMTLHQVSSAVVQTAENKENKAIHT